jgi:undecaprenyl pyrophosphate phosphatase UppP
LTGPSLPIGVSLALLSLALGFLSARGARQFWRTRARVQLAWSLGLALATAAMAVETLVYAGWVDQALLQAYVVLSAVLVGVLSLGAARVMRSPRFQRAYVAYILGASAVVGVASFLTPIAPGSMVSGGIITGDPPLSLILFSILVTGPATVVLLASAAVSLRRTRKWQNLLLIVGALVLGAGGTLYIASFPVALYYGEFIGIVFLFFGLLSLPQSTTLAPSALPAAPVVDRRL